MVAFDAAFLTCASEGEPEAEPSTASSAAWSCFAVSEGSEDRRRTTASIRRSSSVAAGVAAAEVAAAGVAAAGVAAAEVVTTWRIAPATAGC